MGARQSLGEVGPKIADGVKDLPGGVSQSKIRLAAGDVMSAVFRATSTAQSDKRSNVSRDMLRSASKASATRGGNAVIADLGRELRRSKGTLRDKVAVLYEDGAGPGLKEFRTATASGDLRGTSILKRWEAKDDNGVLHVGTVVGWTYGQLENAKAIDSPGRVAGAASRGAGGNTASDQARVSKTVNNKDDF